MQKRMKIAQAECGYGIAVVPLLLESPELKAMMRRIVVADCDAQTQMQRAKARIGWRESEIKSAMAAQMSREKRRNLADDILENDGDFSSLKKQVAELHRRFIIHLAIAQKNDRKKSGGATQNKRNRSFG